MKGFAMDRKPLTGDEYEKWCRDAKHNHSARTKTTINGKVARYGYDTDDDYAEFRQLLGHDGFVWTNEDPLPRIGDVLYVAINSIGTGVVRGYFYEPGEDDRRYVGVYVQPDNPPRWWVRQNIADLGSPRLCCLAFGREVEITRPRKYVRFMGGNSRVVNSLTFTEVEPNVWEPEGIPGGRIEMDRHDQRPVVRKVNP